MRGDGQGLRAALAAMATYEDDEDIQRSATYLLTSMLGSDKSYTRAVLEDDGLRIILRNTRVHSGLELYSESMKLLAGMAVYSINDSDDMVDLLIKEGCAHAFADWILTQTGYGNSAYAHGGIEKEHVYTASVCILRT